MKVEGWEYLGDGRNRSVYRRRGFVLKIPLNEAGLHDNIREADVSRRYGGGPDPDGCYYARCRILRNGWLLMVEVNPTYLPKDQRPDWADWIDCQQVGLRRGKVVAYDYGY